MSDGKITKNELHDNLKTEIEGKANQTDLDTISLNLDNTIQSHLADNIQSFNNVDIKLNTKVLKNWIINGGFDIWQRGTSQTTTMYGSDDRWSNDHIGSTKTHSRQSFAIGQTDVPNNPTYFSRTVVSSVVGADNAVDKTQRIEDVTKLAGKIVTLSFWAKADSNKNMAVSFNQFFGSGGSPSITGISPQKFALTTSWQRFTLTLTLPSISGKTVGAGSHTPIIFWFDAGTNLNSISASLGQQSGTFDIANISLVEGTVAQEWQTEKFDDVLRQCQRYYEKSYPMGLFAGGISSDGVFCLYEQNIQNAFYIGNADFKVSKRISGGTGYIYSPVTGAISKVSIAGADKNVSCSVSQNSITVYQNEVSTNSGNVQFHWIVDVEL